MSLTPAPSPEFVLRLLAYIGGVASTLVGSLISSKIHVYHENRKAHLEDLKQKVLIPINSALVDNYKSLVCNSIPSVCQSWGTLHRTKNVSVTECTVEEGHQLAIVAPDVLSVTDSVLYADAKKKHFPGIIFRTEEFLAAWRAHASECRNWVLALSQEILTESGLPEYQGTTTGNYIFHYRLGIFVYSRLFEIVRLPVSKSMQYPNKDYWRLEGFESGNAAGSESDMDIIIGTLNVLMDRERDKAQQLRDKAHALQRKFESLCSELDYAIASRGLHWNCDLVSFF